MIGCLSATPTLCFPLFFFFFLLFLQLVEQQQRKTLIGFFRQKDALMNKSPKKLK